MIYLFQIPSPIRAPQHPSNIHCHAATETLDQTVWAASVEKFLHQQVRRERKANIRRAYRKQHACGECDGVVDERMVVFYRSHLFTSTAIEGSRRATTSPAPFAVRTLAHTENVFKILSAKVTHAAARVRGSRRVTTLVLVWVLYLLHSLRLWCGTFRCVARIHKHIENRKGTRCVVDSLLAEQHALDIGRGRPWMNQPATAKAASASLCCKQSRVRGWNSRRERVRVWVVTKCVLMGLVLRNL